MQIAALYDIHSNLPALDGVLREASDLKVDRIVVGGDVLPGPMPREALERLAELECPVDYILGNGEVAVLDCLAGRTPRAPEQYQPTLRWVAGEISSDQVRFISGWPKTLRVTMEGLGEVFSVTAPQGMKMRFSRNLLRKMCSCPFLIAQKQN